MSRKFRSPHGLQKQSFSLPISVICTGVVPRHQISDFLISEAGAKKRPKRRTLGPPPSDVMVGPDLIFVRMVLRLHRWYASYPESTQDVYLRHAWMPSQQGVKQVDEYPRHPSISS